MSRRRYIVIACVAAVGLTAMWSASNLTTSQAEGPPPPSLSKPWRQASDQSPEALYIRKCNICHGPGGAGWLQLSKRTGPQQASLLDRTDLSPELVRTVVRGGMGGMPPLTRIDVSDTELDRIATFLAKQGPKQ